MHAKNMYFRVTAAAFSLRSRTIKMTK